MVVRKKRTQSSILDGVEGVGPTTHKKLIKIFGSVSGIKQASLEDLVVVVGQVRARAIRESIGTDER